MTELPPMVDEYLPREQATQTLYEVASNETEYEPGLQPTQAPNPVVLAYVPALQEIHTVAPDLSL